MPLTVRTCASYDAVALGEIMLRLDPGAGRIRTARQFDHRPGRKIPAGGRTRSGQRSFLDVEPSTSGA